MSTRRRYTVVEKAFLTGLSGRGLSYKAVAKAFNRQFAPAITWQMVKSFFRYHRLTTGWCMQGLRFSPATEFKHGNRPQTWRPLGSERITADGITEIKIAEPNRWRSKHRVIWEAENGPVPRGHVFIFADRNRRNFDLNNLILVSRSELATLNKFGRITTDAELTRSGVLFTRLNQKIKKTNKRFRAAV